MKITRDNCEAYFLDYHEGNLTPEMAAEVLLFVEQNPAFRNTFESFESFDLATDQNMFFNKKELLKQVIDFNSSSITEQNIDEFLIAEIEGLLSNEVIGGIDSFIASNPQYAQSRKLYSFTRLNKAELAVFENKSDLFKKAIPVGSLNEATIDSTLIAELEGSISAVERLELEQYLKYNPQADFDRKVYSKTILKADENIVFPRKRALKQSASFPRRVLYPVLLVAASITLLIGFYFSFHVNTNQLQGNEKGGFSEVKKTIVKPTRDTKINVVEQLIKEKETAITSQTNKRRSHKNPLTPNNQNTGISIPDQLQVFEKEIVSSEIACIEPIFVKSISSTSYVDAIFIFIRMGQTYVDTYHEYYYNLKLADELKYAEYNCNDKNPEKTILNAIAVTAENRFASLINKPERETTPFNGWSFAELGVKTYNTITGSDIELILQKDEQGNVMSYGIESTVMNFELETRASKQNAQ